MSDNERVFIRERMCRMEEHVNDDAELYLECSECKWQLHDRDYPISVAREWLIHCPYCVRVVTYDL